MATTILYHGYTLWPILDDEDDTKVIGWDIHHRDLHGVDSEPVQEMLPSLAAAKAWVRDDVAHERFMRKAGAR